MINENIRFLKQLVELKQREVNEVLNYDHSIPYTNKKRLESAKAHQQSCADALNFLHTLETRE